MTSIRESFRGLTKKLTRGEFQSALLLFLLGVLVRVIPDRVVDPWGVFNPKSFATIVLVLGALEFLSAILAKLFTERSSRLLIGFVGGLVSSTAVILSSARESRVTHGGTRARYIPLVAAQIASFVELLLIAAMISPVLFWRVLPPVAVSTALAAVGLAVLSWKAEPVKAPLALHSSLDWKGVFRLSLLFAAMLAFIAVAKRALGDRGALAFSMIGGAFELHGVTLANATMLAQNQTSLDAASFNVLVAATSSLLAKILINLMVARNRFALIATGIYIALAAGLWGSELVLRIFTR